jgi:pimeloyl-ACP methyl ester carboxylesterase
MSRTEPKLVDTGESARLQLLAGLDVIDQTVDLAGIPTAILETGDGPPIVLLHGPGEFKERWVRVIPELSRTHRVIAPDFPGHGRSGTHPDGLDAERVFAWIDALLDNCCRDHPVLVGHILGGSVAARYAAARPGRLDRLVLVDSLGLAKFRPNPRFALGLIGFMMRPGARSHRRFMGQCLADADTVEEAMGDKWAALREYSVDRAKDPGVKTAMKTMMSELGVPPIPVTDLESISTPTELVWGRDDRANRLGIAEATSTRFGWPLRVIDGAADDPPMEQPEQFAAAVITSDHEN